MIIQGIYNLGILLAPCSRITGNPNFISQYFFHYEFCIIHMQQLIDFKNKEVKYIRILQDLKNILQDLQKCRQKGHFESWAPIGS